MPNGVVLAPFGAATLGAVALRVLAANVGALAVVSMMAPSCSRRSRCPCCGAGLCSCRPPWRSGSRCHAPLLRCVPGCRLLQKLRRQACRQQAAGLLEAAVRAAQLLPKGVAGVGSDGVVQLERCNPPCIQLVHQLRPTGMGRQEEYQPCEPSNHASHLHSDARAPAAVGALPCSPASAPAHCMPPATHQQLAQVVCALSSLTTGVLAQGHQRLPPHEAGQEAALSQALDLALGAWGRFNGAEGCSGSGGRRRHGAAWPIRFAHFSAVPSHGCHDSQLIYRTTSGLLSTRQGQSQIHAATREAASTAAPPLGPRRPPLQVLAGPPPPPPLWPCRMPPPHCRLQC